MIAAIAGSYSNGGGIQRLASPDGPWLSPAATGLPQLPDTGIQTNSTANAEQGLGGVRGGLLSGGTLAAASEAEADAETEESALGLTEEEQQIVDELKKRDREVRAHEQAHAAVGGAYAGSPVYEYEAGPDGNRYAVGGSVSIDVSPIPGDPEATIQKMEIVKRAALAPGEPSPQDRAVAAAADQARLQAQAEKQQQDREDAQGLGGEGDPAKAAGAYGQAASKSEITPILIQIAA